MHACTPNLGQGACQALEDAVVLAHCLSGTLPIGAALRKYERLLHSAYQGNRSEVLANREHAATRLASVGIVPGTWLGTRLAIRIFGSLLTHQLPRLRSQEELSSRSAHRGDRGPDALMAVLGDLKCSLTLQTFACFVNINTARA